MSPGKLPGSRPCRSAPQLAKLTRPRLHKAVTRGLVSAAGARLRGARRATASRIGLRR